ncbi:MAG: metalloregulator ArsR/SmtB family transcription factor [Pseudomonadota bacterium]
MTLAFGVSGLLEKTPLSLDQTVSLLRAAGEPTRLRLLMLLAKRDLTVSDLTEILGQSQPRISRHLKLLSEAGLLERYQEGAWAYFRLTDQGTGSGIINTLVRQVSLQDTQVERDQERLGNLCQRLADRAQEYFTKNAGDWDKIRSLHVDEDQVESAMLEMVGDAKFNAMLDLGTGTGRILELFSHLYEKGTGIDASRDMLSLARTRLDSASLSRVQTRQGNLYILPTQSASFNFVTIHQVLHFLDDPMGAIREAAKALAPDGRLLIVDFAPHTLEFLQHEHAHRRLGFSDSQITEWLGMAGLSLENTKHLRSAQSNQADGERLTVSLWLARK